MDVPAKRIPNKLKRYRKLAGYSQKDVAKALKHKSTNRICLWERGIAYPSIRNLLKLELLYSTLPAELYCEFYDELREEIKAFKQEFILSRVKPK
jgi:transcriptional regulator with XRE-family HTH domain